RDGRLFAQEVTLTLLGETGLICVTRDISERQRAQRDRARLRDQLAGVQRQEAVGQLAAGIAHDFNNLLGAITVSATLQRDDLTAAGANTAHLDRILRASDTASSLVSRLLRQARPKPRAARTDLRAPLGDVIDLVRAGAPANLEIAVAAPDAPVIAPVDATDFSQILLNLAINARDAIGPAGGRIDVRLAALRGAEVAGSAVAIGELDQAAPYALLEVRDTGHGLAADALQSIFEPFVTTKGADGTGLGLSVVSGLMKKAGGAIAVRSELGAGACFQLFWPMGEDNGAHHADTALNAAPTSETAHSADAASALAGATLLLVDDDAEIAGALAAALERVGAEIVVATDPRDAAEALSAPDDPFALLITDFDMPHLDGAALARIARAARPERPVLLLTALADAETRPGVAEGLFDTVLSKPISPGALATAAGALLTDRPARAAAKPTEETACSTS
ncbi:MAG: ATP-binding protein, partial [Pseudomonadota bacterium]